MPNSATTILKYLIFLVIANHSQLLLMLRGMNLQMRVVNLPACCIFYIKRQHNTHFIQ